MGQATQPDLWQKTVGNNLKLSPSGFAFLWQECKRCFYLKVARNFYRPRTVMPKVFTIIDAEMKKCFSGRRTETIAADMPAVSFSLVRSGSSRNPSITPTTRQPSSSGASTIRSSIR